MALATVITTRNTPCPRRDRDRRKNSRDVRSRPERLDHGLWSMQPSPVEKKEGGPIVGHDIVNVSFPLLPEETETVSSHSGRPSRTSFWKNASSLIPRDSVAAQGAIFQEGQDVVSNPVIVGEQTAFRVPGFGKIHFVQILNRSAFPSSSIVTSSFVPPKSSFSICLFWLALARSIGAAPRPQAVCSVAISAFPATIFGWGIFPERQENGWRKRGLVSSHVNRTRTTRSGLSPESHFICLRYVANGHFATLASSNFLRNGTQCFHRQSLSPTCPINEASPSS